MIISFLRTIFIVWLIKNEARTTFQNLFLKYIFNWKAPWAILGTIFLPAVFYTWNQKISILLRCLSERGSRALQVLWRAGWQAKSPTLVPDVACLSFFLPGSLKFLCLSGIALWECALSSPLSNPPHCPVLRGRGGFPLYWRNYWFLCTAHFIDSWLLHATLLVIWYNDE